MQVPLMTRPYNNNIKIIYDLVKSISFKKVLSQLIVNYFKLFNDFDCFNINEF